MNRLRKTALTLSVAAFALMGACRDDKVPPDVMDEEQMTSFMQDAYLLEGYYAVGTGFMYDTMNAEMIASYDTLLTSRGLTSDDFQRSMEWYSRHPEIFQRVHDTILARFDRAMEEDTSQSELPEKTVTIPAPDIFQ
ncbi:MAG: DUF4296 domain-containing protein [Bacteroidales bacterium]|nr:DUF4296 domain-containing protein [Bacteroidales bacterium]